MSELRTDPMLLEALQKAVKAGVSASELRAQKVSYILSAVSEESNITKERVEQVLASQEGVAA